jgi:hypothetical protein
MHDLIEQRAGEIFDELRPLNRPENYDVLMKHARWIAEHESVEMTHLTYTPGKR